MKSSNGPWRCEVDRGPNWLFVKLFPPALPAEQDELADNVWAIASRHFVYRLVVEMDLFDSLSSQTIDQLLELQSRLEAHGGALRVCGLSCECLERLEQPLHSHATRAAAVLGADHADHRLPTSHFEPAYPASEKKSHATAETASAALVAH